MHSPSWPAALESAFACLGQSKRLPGEIESSVIDTLEGAYETPKSNPRTRTNQILMGALVARTNGNFQEALDWLDEWPFRTTPPKSKYYLKVMLEHSQHLLIANCYAHLNQIEQAKENLQRGDNLLAQYAQNWWAPVVLAGLRAETEALITATKRETSRARPPSRQAAKSFLTNKNLRSLAPWRKNLISHGRRTTPACLHQTPLVRRHDAPGSGYRPETVPAQRRAPLDLR